MARLSSLVEGVRIHTDSMPYNARSATLDGAADYFEGALTLSDTKTGTLSFWFKRSTGDLEGILYNTGNKVSISFPADDTIRVRLTSPASAVVIDYKTTSTIDGTSDTDWHHFIISWDANNAATTPAYAYLDGVAESLVEQNAATDNVVDWTVAATALGAVVGGGSHFTGCFAEFYLSQVYTDITDAATLAKFIANGRPVDLGSDGSTPTGTAPAVYLNQNGSSFGTDQSGNSNDLTANGSPLVCSAEVKL